MTAQQRARLEEAKTSDRPVLIVTEEEARETEKTKEKGLSTWRFKAKNVRDFAFASSRKFIWDAMAVPLENSTPMAMSYYPKEGVHDWLLSGQAPVWTGGQRISRILCILAFP